MNDRGLFSGGSHLLHVFPHSDQVRAGLDFPGGSDGKESENLLAMQETQKMRL